MSPRLKLLSRYLSVFLSFLLVFNLFGYEIVSAFQEPRPEMKDVIGNPNPSRSERVELQDFRTSSSKRFLNPDGTMMEEIYLSNIHYKEGKRWLDIDNTIVPSDDPDFKYKNKANRFEASFSDTTKGNRFLRFKKGDLSLEMIPVGLLTGSAKVEKNKVTYAKDITENTGNGLQANLEYFIGYDSVKEDIVLDYLAP